MKTKLILYCIALFTYSCISHANSFIENRQGAISSYLKIRDVGIFATVEIFEYSFDKKVTAEFLEKLEELPLYADNEEKTKQILTDYWDRSKHANFSRINIDILGSDYKVTCLYAEHKSENGKKIISDKNITFSGIGQLISKYDTETKKLLLSTIPAEAAPYKEIPFIKMYMLSPYILVEPPSLKLNHDSIKIQNNNIITLKCLKNACTERIYTAKQNFPIVLKMRLFKKNFESKEKNISEIFYKCYKPFENKLFSQIYFPSIIVESPSIEGDVRQITVAYIKAMREKHIKESDLEIDIDKDAKIYPYLDEANAR